MRAQLPNSIKSCALYVCAVQMVLCSNDFTCEIHEELQFKAALKTTHPGLDFVYSKLKMTQTPKPQVRTSSVASVKCSKSIIVNSFSFPLHIDLANLEPRSQGYVFWSREFSFKSSCTNVGFEKKELSIWKRPNGYDGFVARPLRGTAAGHVYTYVRVPYLHLHGTGKTAVWSWASKTTVYILFFVLLVHFVSRIRSWMLLWTSGIESEVVFFLLELMFCFCALFLTRISLHAQNDEK